MADERQRDRLNVPDDANRDPETDDGAKPEPAPSSKQAPTEVESEDRFEATDN